MAGFLFLCMFVGFFVLLFVLAIRQSKIRRREQIINNFRFPDRISQKIKTTYPHLTEQQTAQVILGLREYFQVCNVAGKRMVAMPSQAVDVAWHEFILFTKQYQVFCKQALGRFLHHTPAEAMSTATVAQTGIKTAWRIACTREKITPNKPDHLPLLFALDSLLAIPDGFTYCLDCTGSLSDGKNAAGDSYCASHIGCGSGCASCSSCGGDGGGCGGD